MSSVGELQDKDIVSSIVDSSLEEKENDEKSNNIVLGDKSKFDTLESSVALKVDSNLKVEKKIDSDTKFQVTENLIENEILNNSVSDIVDSAPIEPTKSTSIIEESEQEKEQTIGLDEEHSKIIIESISSVDAVEEEKNEEQTSIMEEVIKEEVIESPIETEQDQVINEEVTDNNITSDSLKVEEQTMMDTESSINEEDVKKEEALDFKGFPVGVIPEKADYLLTNDRHQYLSLSTICRTERDTKRIYSVGVLLSDKGDTQIPKHNNSYRLLKICNLKGTAFFLYIQKPVDLEIGNNNIYLFLYII